MSKVELISLGETYILKFVYIKNVILLQHYNLRESIIVNITYIVNIIV